MVGRFSNWYGLVGFALLLMQKVAARLTAARPRDEMPFLGGSS